MQVSRRKPPISHLTPSQAAIDLHLEETDDVELQRSSPPSSKRYPGVPVPAKPNDANMPPILHATPAATIVQTD